MGWLWCEVHETIPDTCPTHSAGNTPSLLQSHSKNSDYNRADDTGIATPCNSFLKFWCLHYKLSTIFNFNLHLFIIGYWLAVHFMKEQFTGMLYFQLKWLLLIPDKMYWIVLFLKIFNLLTRIMSSWYVILIEVTHIWSIFHCYIFLYYTFWKLAVLPCSGKQHESYSIQSNRWSYFCLQINLGHCASYI
jgi:hypothetical protein